MEESLKLSTIKSDVSEGEEMEVFSDSPTEKLFLLKSKALPPLMEKFLRFSF